jgi:predicted NUDIX family NTP pyrophosphohydrolase
MAKHSAGLLMYRRQQNGTEVFLVHPGGPYWANKDEGAWTIPKGEPNDVEEPFATAKREFFEETGFTADGEFLSLGEVRQKGGKLVTAWAFLGDCDPAQLRSNMCEIEWPPKSKKRLQIPEIDRGRWFTITEAREYIRPELDVLLLRLVSLSAHEINRSGDK